MGIDVDLDAFLGYRIHPSFAGKGTEVWNNRAELELGKDENYGMGPMQGKHLPLIWLKLVFLILGSLFWTIYDFC